MARTRKAPWDYDRAGQLCGEEQKANRAVWDEFLASRQALVALIGWSGYNQFYSRQSIVVKSNMRLLTTEIQHELDWYGCSCNPVNEPCPGCKHLYETRRELHMQGITEMEKFFQPAEIG